MVLPRRRPHDEPELPELPPLDGDETDEALDVGNDVDELADDAAALDDAAADDLAIDELDTPEDAGIGDQGGDGPEDPGDDADEIDGDDGARWTDDDAREPDDGAEVDEIGAFSPDDQGLDGPEGEGLDELEELPPLDDDPDGDRPVGDESADDGGLEAFALEMRDGCVMRVLFGGAAGAAVTALGLAAGRERVYVVGDALVSLSIASLDDPKAPVEALEGVEVDELFSSVLEDANGGLWLGALSGAVWRRARARDTWRRVVALSDGRSTGAVALSLEGRRVWALTALGTLHRSEEAARFESTLTGEHVRALAVDPRGGALAAVSGRRRDALRSSTDGGRTWTALSLPEEISAGCVARASDVFVTAPGDGGGDGYVSVDGGATWSAWPLLAGASAVSVVEADDGDARVFFTAYDEGSDRVVLATARVGAKGEAVAACGLGDLGEVLPRADHDDDDSAHRVDRIVSLDRAGRHLALVTSRGAVVLVSLPT